MQFLCGIEVFKKVLLLFFLHPAFLQGYVNIRELFTKGLGNLLHIGIAWQKNNVISCFGLHRCVNHSGNRVQGAIAVSIAGGNGVTQDDFTLFCREWRRKKQLSGLSCSTQQIEIIINGRKRRRKEDSASSHGTGFL